MDLFVSPAGDDANSGAKDAPVKTITRALALATPGDTVAVTSGEYPASDWQALVGGAVLSVDLKNK